MNLHFFGSRVESKGRGEEEKKSKRGVSVKSEIMMMIYQCNDEFWLDVEFSRNRYKPTNITCPSCNKDALHDDDSVRPCNYTKNNRERVDELTRRGSSTAGDIIEVEYKSLEKEK